MLQVEDWGRRLQQKVGKQFAARKYTILSINMLGFCCKRLPTSKLSLSDLIVNSDVCGEVQVQKTQSHEHTSLQFLSLPVSLILSVDLTFLETHTF